MRADTGCRCDEPQFAIKIDGLFELRLKGADGIARVFFCTLIGRRVMMLYAFVKKTQKTPPRVIEVARKRMKEVRHANS